MTTLRTFFIEPLEPQVYGDGKPNSAVAGHLARSRALPPPSQLAGAVRTAAGLGKDGRFDSTRLAEVLRHVVQGPLLAIRTAGRVEPLWPAPADAVLFETAPKVVRSQPFAIGQALTSEDEFPVGHNRPDKPQKGAPPFWSQQAMLSWLCGEIPDAIEEQPQPQPVRRLHVSIDPETQTASDGKLYGIESRAFPCGERPLGLLCKTDAPIADGMRVLGGEQRLSRWRAMDAAWPDVPAAVIRSVRAGACRVVLGTPGWFAAGSVPTDLISEAPAGTRRVAQISGRAEVISGFDYKLGQPKPTRRLVPAGAVFFLALGGTPDEREAWARRVWLTNQSDAGGDGFRPRLDGFGLSLVGTWDGQTNAMTLGGN